MEAVPFSSSATSLEPGTGSAADLNELPARNTPSVSSVSAEESPRSVDESPRNKSEITSGEVSETVSTGSSAPQPHPLAAKKPSIKRTPNDFIFGKTIGEGSYSTVNAETYTL